MNTRALTRPTAPRKLRITLTAEHAAEAARNEVRAAIRAWDVPVDTSVAALLTGELVTNALRHEAGRAIELAKQRGDVTLHRPHRDEQPLRDLGVRQVLGDAGEHLRLTGGDTRRGRRRLGVHHVIVTPNPSGPGTCDRPTHSRQDRCAQPCRTMFAVQHGLPPVERTVTTPGGLI